MTLLFYRDPTSEDWDMLDMRVMSIGVMLGIGQWTAWFQKHLGEPSVPVIQVNLERARGDEPRRITVRFADNAEDNYIMKYNGKGQVMLVGPM